MVDAVGVERCTGELLEEVGFFVGDAGGTDDARFPACLELLNNGLQGAGPTDFFELSVHAHERRLETFRMVVEIEGVAAFDAEEFAVDAGAIAVVATDDFVGPDAEGGLATV